MDKGYSQYSMSEVIYFGPASFLMDSYPWEPRFLTQVVLFLFGFLLYAMIAL